MATYYSDAYGGPNNLPVSRKYQETGVWSVSAEFTLTAALDAGDVIKMCPTVAGSRVKDLILTSTDVDTDGSPAIIYDVGDADGTPDPDRYIDGATIGQTGGMARMSAVAGMNYRFQADGSIDVTVPVAPATGATTGTIKLTVLLAADDTP